MVKRTKCPKRVEWLWGSRHRGIPVVCYCSGIQCHSTISDWIQLTLRMVSQTSVSRSEKYNNKLERCIPVMFLVRSLLTSYVIPHPPVCSSVEYLYFLECIQPVIALPAHITLMLIHFLFSLRPPDIGTYACLYKMKCKITLNAPEYAVLRLWLAYRQVESCHPRTTREGAFARLYAYKNQHQFIFSLA